MRWIRVIFALVLMVSLVSGSPTTAAAETEDFVLYEQSAAQLAFEGSWATHSTSALSGGSHALTNGAGASVTTCFVGTAFELVAMMGPKSGIAAVSIDGGSPVDVDLYSPDTLFQQPVFTSGSLAQGLHVARVAWSGRKRAASSDTFVGIDAIRVRGELASRPENESNSFIVRRGSWAAYGDAALVGGGHMLTNTVGSETAVAFVGTRLDLVSMTGPKFGIAAVSVDGSPPVDVSLYSPDTLARQVVFTTGDLPQGSHVVRVTCTGRRPVGAVDAFIGLDAVLVTGVLQQAMIRHEETEPLLGWGGQLSEGLSTSMSGGRYVWAGPGWGAVAVSFVGTRLDWVAVTGPQFGIASISVDDGPALDVDLYNPALLTHQVSYSTGDLAFGPHTVKIGWTGRKNAASSGTFISYDAFDIGGDPIQASVPVPPPTPVSFNYPWSRYILIDKSDLRLYLVENGALVVSYPVAVGKPSTPTPSAVWRIDAKYYSSGVFGPRKMRLFRQSGDSFVYTAYNLHGTDTDSSIGTYASHGCIRMHNYDVIPFFDMVPLGTMVVTRD